MSSIVWILISAVILAVISLVGGFAILLSKQKFSQLIIYLVSFAAGSLLSGAIVHLMPESFEQLGNNFLTSILILCGIVLFYILEQFVHWHHCHRAVESHIHPVSYLILVADSIHNLIDGLAVGTAFVIDGHLGIATLIAVIAHEIPQELGDFGILIHSGWTAKRALIFNLLSSATFFIGSILALFASQLLNVAYLLPLAAGGFIYIAAVDLLPQIHKECETKARLSHFFSFILGIIILVVLKIFFV